MISRKTLRNAGAAILGTLVGTSPAYAANLDSDGDVENQISYALETLSGASSHTTTIDEVTYYHSPHRTDRAGSPVVFDFKMPISAADGDTLRFTFNYEGMAIGDNADLADSSLRFHATLAGSQITAIDDTDIDLFVGGEGKQQSVQFLVTLGGAALTTDNYARLTFNEFYVTADGTGGTGSIEMASVVRTASGVTLPEVSGQRVPGIRVVRALMDETTTATNATASVEDGFLSFRDADGSVSIGTIKVNTMLDDVFAVIEAGNGGAATLQTSPNNIVASTSRVTFGGGDLSFVDDVFLADTAACASGGTSLVTTEGEGDEQTMVWKTENDRLLVDAFVTEQHICIDPDGETPIPETEPFTAVLGYAPVSDDIAFPPAPSPVTLGRIERDGTTVNLAYLTTSRFYSQRLVLRNRGSDPVEYSLAFATEDGIEAQAGEDASGMLQPGVTVLSLVRDDVVTITGGNRAAATLTVVAPQSQIGVATTQVTLDSRTTDTVVYLQ